MDKTKRLRTTSPHFCAFFWHFGRRLQFPRRSSQIWCFLLFSGSSLDIWAQEQDVSSGSVTAASCIFFFQGFFLLEHDRSDLIDHVEGKKNRLKTETLTCFRLLNVTICCFSPWYFTVGWISFGVSGLRKVLISSLQTNLVFSSPQWKLGWHLRCHSVLWEVCEGHTDFCNYTQP